MQHYNAVWGRKPKFAYERHVKSAVRLAGAVENEVTPGVLSAPAGASERPSQAANGPAQAGTDETAHAARPSRPPPAEAASAKGATRTTDASSQVAAANLVDDVVELVHDVLTPAAPDLTCAENVVVTLELKNAFMRRWVEHCMTVTV